MAPALDSIVSLISLNLGLSPSVSKFLLAHAAAVPTALLFRLIPRGRVISSSPSSPSSSSSSSSAVLVHLFSALSGVLLSILAFGLNSLPLIFVPVVIAYLSMLTIPRHCGSATFAATFTFLIACHVWFMSGHSWREGGIDCTGALMILTLKSIAVAMDCQDGVRSKLKQKKAKEETAEDVPKANGSMGVVKSATAKGSDTGLQQRVTSDVKTSSPEAQGEGKKEETSSSSQGVAVEPSRPRQLSGIPGVVEVLGFCFCTGLHFAGPFYFFGDYKKWAEAKEEYVWLADKQQRHPPFVLRLLRALGQAGISAVVYLFLNSMLDISVIFSPSLYFSLPIWQRAWILYLAGTATRWKYYFIWSISEATMIASGLGFSGWARVSGSGGSFQEVASWERAENCHILGVELATSAALFAVNWNISVGRWLRSYVYERLVAPGKKPGFMQLLVTQLVAGVWHGLYPGYILFFSGIAWEVAASRVLFKWEKKIPANRRGLRTLASFTHGIFAAFCNNFFAIGFNVLTAKDTFTAWAGLYYAGVIIPAIIMALDMVLPSKKEPKKKTT